jgi:branched-chain amino acid transport system ATP-binding protein
MGAYVRTAGREILEDIERMYDLFPVVRDRRRQLASTLSGGEQQMVAMARALMARPRLLIMDEPSMGLSPLFVDKVFDIIQQINQTQGVSILLVEQNANMALSIASRGYVLQTGEIVLNDTAQNLLNNPLMQEAYLGVA